MADDVGKLAAKIGLDATEFKARIADPANEGVGRCQYKIINFWETIC